MAGSVRLGILVPGPTLPTTNRRRSAVANDAATFFANRMFRRLSASFTDTLLRDAPDGPFSTNILWDRAIEEGRAFGAVHQGLWFDVGTPQSIPMTEAALENV